MKARRGIDATEAPYRPNDGDRDIYDRTLHDVGRDVAGRGGGDGYAWRISGVLRSGM